MNKSCTGYIMTRGEQKKREPKNRIEKSKNRTEKSVNQVEFLRIFSSVNQTGNFVRFRFIGLKKCG